MTNAEDDDDTPVSAERSVATSVVGFLRARPALTALGVVLVAVLGAAFVSVNQSDPEPPAPQPDIALDAWAPYWALDDALPEFEQRVRSMRAVSPFWFNAIGVDDIAIDPNALDEGLDEFILAATSADIDDLRRAAA